MVIPRSASGFRKETNTLSTELRGREVQNTSMEDGRLSTQKGVQYMSYTKQKDGWYPDGSVIIAIQQTVFRLHRSLLSKQSEILRERFEAADDDPETQYHQSCPVVVLRGTPNDFAMLLKAMEFGM